MKSIARNLKRFPRVAGSMGQNQRIIRRLLPLRRAVQAAVTAESHPKSSQKSRLPLEVSFSKIWTPFLNSLIYLETIISNRESVGTRFWNMVWSKSPCKTARISEVPHGPAIDCFMEHGSRCCHQPQAVGALPGSGFASPNGRRNARVLSHAVWSDPNFLRRFNRVNAEIIQPRE